MSATMMEGRVCIKVPINCKARKFDARETHGVSHCMSAVDFVFELDDRIYFVEVKDPLRAPLEHQMKGLEYVRTFSLGNEDVELCRKYRDSFLYEWAMKNTNKPIYYLVLIIAEKLTEAELLIRQDALKRIIPQGVPRQTMWKRSLNESCIVLNLKTWNKFFPKFQATLIETEFKYLSE